MGTQEYAFTPAEFLDRFEGAYGNAARLEVAAHFH